MALSFEARNINGIVSLHLSGEMDAGSRKKLEEMAEVLSENNGLRCVLDLSGVITADSIGYVGLLNFSKIIRQRGGICGVCSMSQELFDLVERSGGLHSLKVFSDPQSAAESLAEMRLPSPLSADSDKEGTGDAGNAPGGQRSYLEDLRKPLPNPDNYNYRRIIEMAIEAQARRAQTSEPQKTANGSGRWRRIPDLLKRLGSWQSLFALGAAIVIYMAPGEKGRAIPLLSILCALLPVLGALTALLRKRLPAMVMPILLLALCLLQAIPYVQSQRAGKMGIAFAPALKAPAAMATLSVKPDAVQPDRADPLTALKVAKWTYPSTAALLCCWLYVAFRAVMSRVHAAVRIIYTLVLLYGLLPLALAVNLPLQRVAGISLFGFPTLMEPRILLALIGAPCFGAGVIMGWIRELMTEKDELLQDSHELWEKGMTRVAEILLSLCLAAMMVIPVIRG